MAFARQAVLERQLFFTAGEKLALLSLSLLADQESLELLQEETAVLKRRVRLARRVECGAKVVRQKVLDHKRSLDQLIFDLDPDGDWAKQDANRLKLLATMARGVSNGAQSFDPSWWAAASADYAPSPTDTQIAIPLSARVAEFEGELTSRAALASSRVAHQRAIAEARSVNISAAASRFRVSASRVTREIDEAIAQLAKARDEAAEKLRDRKLSYSTEISLLGFRDQAKAARHRGRELLSDATERARLAGIGLREVYGLDLIPPAPATNSLMDAEALLSWCRTTARMLSVVELRACRDTCTLSLARVLGSNWRQSLEAGASCDLSYLAHDRSVLRARDSRASVKTTAIGSVTVTITSPADATDVTTQGLPRNVKQGVRSFSITAQNWDDSSRRSAQSVSRLVHNLAVAGVWTIKTEGDLASVDDVILEIDVSYLGLI